jgi:hypothetical protein
MLSLCPGGHARAMAESMGPLLPRRRLPCFFQPPVLSWSAYLLFPKQVLHEGPDPPAWLWFSWALLALMAVFRHRKRERSLPWLIASCLLVAGWVACGGGGGGGGGSGAPSLPVASVSPSSLSFGNQRGLVQTSGSWRTNCRPSYSRQREQQSANSELDRYRRPTGHPARRLRGQLPGIKREPRFRPR